MSLSAPAAAAIQALAPLVDEAVSSGRPLALLMLGLQGQRRFRIEQGHEAAATLARRVGELAGEVLRPGDLIVPVGAADFALALPGIGDGNHALLAAARLLRQFEAPLDVMGRPVLAPVAVGVALCPEHGHDAAWLLRHAEAALLEARAAPDHMIVCRERLPESGIDPAELLEAIHGGQLSLHLQPQWDLRRKRVVGAEALARWEHPTRGVVSPGVFVPIAERSGMIGQFTRWSINACLQHVAEARQRGLELPISLNLSAVAFAERGLVEQLLGAISLWNVSPRDLVIEVTETAIVADLARGAVLLKRLNAEGIRVSVDDFGVGNASVSYLKQFPATEMKIDQSFVTHMLGDLRSMQLVKAMIVFAQQLGMRVVAEGVEDADTLQALADLNCNLAQGFGVGRPVPAAQFIEDLARAKP